jgi:hypothetical protein
MPINVSVRHDALPPMSTTEAYFESLCIDAFVRLRHIHIRRRLNTHEIRYYSFITGERDPPYRVRIPTEFPDPGTSTDTKTPADISMVVPTTDYDVQSSTVPSTLTSPPTTGTRTPISTTSPTPTSTMALSTKSNHATHNQPAGVLGAEPALGLALFLIGLAILGRSAQKQRIATSPRNTFHIIIILQ